MQSTSSISSLIWSTADDDLRGLFKPSEYGRVILPFVVMRRLDCVLESKKDEVYNLYQKFKDQFDDTNWKQEILGSLEFNQSKFASKLLKNGAKSFMQSVYLGWLYTRWKKLKGYDKDDPVENKGQMQSSFKELED